jgi:hypothetical protein
MIEMNVTQKNMANVFGIEPGLPKIDNHIVESRFRSRVEQRDTIINFERSRGDDSRVTKLPRVENVNQGRRMNYELRSRSAFFRALYDCHENSS